MARELPGQPLQPTALVHEAWLRGSGPGHTNYQNRARFFAAAAEAMRRILIDNARRKHALQGQPVGARASGPLSASYQQSGLDWPLGTSNPDCFCIWVGLGGCREGQPAGARASGPLSASYQQSGLDWPLSTSSSDCFCIRAGLGGCGEGQFAGARASGPLSASYQQSGLDWPLSTSNPDCFCIRAGLGGCGEWQFAGLQTVAPLLLVEH